MSLLLNPPQAPNGYLPGPGDDWLAAPPGDTVNYTGPAWWLAWPQNIPPIPATNFTSPLTTAPFAFNPYPDSTASVVDAIVTANFVSQYGTGSGSGATVDTPSWRRKIAHRPRRRAQVNPNFMGDTAAFPSPLMGIPWWLIGIVGVAALLGMPK